MAEHNRVKPYICTSVGWSEWCCLFSDSSFKIIRVPDTYYSHIGYKYRRFAAQEDTGN